MLTSEKFKDWLFRYQYVYRLRRSERSKKRFLSALVTDIAEMREDLQVVEYGKTKKSASRNVYVGNVEKANKIICTYYDTPPQSLGDYTMFNPQKQGKQTLKFIAITSILMIAVGVLGTLAYMNFVNSPFNLSSSLTILAIIIFGIYFYFLGKVTQGLSNRKTLIRNTSSMLAMLEMIKEIDNQKIAFAFIDEGSYGEHGLEIMQQTVNKKANYFLLDCVGAAAPLHFIGNQFSKQKLNDNQINYSANDEQINYLFAAEERMEENEKKYILPKNVLNQKTLDMNNIERVIKLFTS